ncbi:head completion/stabilization protein [Acinetobacter sp. WZC-1]|uniref:head completion/stabilization protein n=1 Tax=Acinetobacter sp. WZC-1 TaxID=3459034 RepID=UPI00403DC0A2
MLINAPIPDSDVHNPDPDRPNVSVNELLGMVRLDQSKGEYLITEKIVLAMDNINDQTLLLNIETETQIRYYKRAVCYEAAALICEDNLDFDTTTTGQIRGENQQVKTQALRRTVNYSIGKLIAKGRPNRNRVTLL